ncbi:sensor histidine kinase [Sulfurovum mangrovi]|uniref:sensor histidine kinase n=1 Tax=Sulfurovum mangrovi TaxID=2893889 RepID=UPI001E376E34|nr:sensor histidine kinase [Sulfurovum mangrovi]UFH60089.1 sensor histidine kinase [Sulfurovum mangrovi]
MKNDLYHRNTQQLFLRLSKLFFIISMFIISVDTYESYKHHFYTMVWLETTALIAQMIGFILYYFRLISLRHFASILIISVSLLVTMALFIIGENPEFSLFALAILPVFIFFFLGVENGKRFSLFIVLMLALAVLNSELRILEPIIFPSSLYVEILIGYVGISFLHYRFEEYRQSFQIELLTFSKSQKTLLRELNHRVKNNLQMIMGLLLMQSNRVKSDQCKKVLSSQVNRLKTIGLVHEQLSLSSESTTVDIEKYLRSIIKSLQLLTKHTIVLNVENGLKLDTATATYLGLFINEAVSNAIEHAYLTQSGEEIRVSCLAENHTCRLTVEDRGQGFNSNDARNSLGLSLMENISDFLEESFMTLELENGTKITLEFNIKKDSKKLLNSDLL